MTSHSSEQNAANGLPSDFRTIANQYAYDISLNRRRARRVPRSLTLKIQPLNMDFLPDGEPFFAISRDISKNGIGFVNSEPLRHEYVRIGIPEQTDQTVIARICYNHSIGLEYPLYLVGADFDL